VRGEPSSRVRCHVCGTRWTVRARLIVTRRETTLRQEPDACPACEAPLKVVPALDEGVARGLVLLAAGFAAETRHYKTLGNYLREFTRTERDVEALLALAAELDYDAWARDDAARLRRRKQPHVLAVVRFFPKLVALADSGALTERLQAAASRVKARYRSERARHLAIFAAGTTRR
jgi:hypothetical protein